MKKTRLQAPNLKNKFSLFRLQLICLLVLLFSSVFVLNKAFAQNTTVAKPLPPTPFRIGERLTYNVTFEKFKNAAYAETYVVSRGKIADRDVVELQSKLKTTEFMSSAFYLVDESRTTYAAAETGLPLYVRKTSNAGVLPTETINNYLVSPTANFDWLTLIYRARNAGGVGNFPLQEDGKVYNVEMQTGAGEKVKTDAGEFETNVSSVQSEFLTEKGITNFRINLSADETRIPVLIRFKSAKGDFRAELASVQTIDPAATAEATPTPTPRPMVTPRPSVTPPPYVKNQPLSADLPFKLGETLEYQISTGGITIGTVVIAAKERIQVGNEDCLVLSAVVTDAQPGQTILSLNDSIIAHVNPETLTPNQIVMRFAGANGVYNQTTVFDQRSGSAVVNGSARTDIPIGTHTILSLAYAVRSFNLKPSKDPNNPVNDTRVAVFLRTGANVFVLRPSNADIINLKGETVSAQMISITTGEPQIDILNIRLWLGTDAKRLPLRLAIGNYQADLVSEKQIPPR